MQDTVDVRFSKNELNSLAKTKGTCVTLEKKTRVVFLLPSQLSDIKSGIKDNLDSNLLKYDYETKAIIIGYDKIKILSKYGSICYGYSKIALRIEANLYLFKPAIGRILKGVVCKQSGRHIGCLVHRVFNVSIPLENGDGYDCGWDFSIGQDIKFTVVKLDLTSGPLPYIRGQLYVDGAHCGSGGIENGDGDTGVVVVDDGGGGDKGAPEGKALAMQQVLGTPEACSRWERVSAGCQGGEEGLGVPREGGGRTDGRNDARNNLISQLLKTMEMSIAEREVGSPKKSKQKRVSLPLDCKGSPRTPSSIPLPLTPPLGEGLECSPVGGGVTPSGGKGGVKSKKGLVKKGEGGRVHVEGSDSGNIINRLLEMSRRELLGGQSAVETPRGKKRKEGTGLAEGGPGRKLLRRSEGNPARLAVKREDSLRPAECGAANKQLLPATASDKIGGVKWSGTLMPSEKSPPSKTHKLSHSTKGHEESFSGTEVSELGMSTAELLEPAEPPPSRVKRKSLTIKSETLKH